MQDAATNEVVKYLKALVLLQLQTGNSPEERPKPEVLLSRVGLNAREIAELLGKNVGAVAKTLQRAGKGDANL